MDLLKGLQLFCLTVSSGCVLWARPGPSHPWAWRSLRAPYLHAKGCWLHGISMLIHTDCWQANGRRWQSGLWDSNEAGPDLSHRSSPAMELQMLRIENAGGKLAACCRWQWLLIAFWRGTGMRWPFWSLLHSHDGVMSCDVLSSPIH